MSETSKVALVTGASAGIGKAVVKQLLADGYTVYGAARRLENMAELEEAGAKCLAMDITREEDVSRVVDTILSQSGRVDVLINNAGFGSYGSVEDTSIDDARYQFEVNLFGLARLTQALLPQMRERGAGTIVNVSSMGGEIYTPLGAWYHATKFALEGWSDCLRVELAGFGIDVVVVQPGIITTEFGEVVSGPMMERSGNTAYADLARSVATATENSYKEGGGSPPSVIADTISAALRSPKPKTRYVKGKMAAPLLFLRRWTTDRMFDRIVKAAI